MNASNNTKPDWTSIPAGVIFGVCLYFLSKYLGYNDATIQTIATSVVGFLTLSALSYLAKKPAGGKFAIGIALPYLAILLFMILS